ncbi:MAG: hypothetical protein KBD19_04825 [Candidatus Moranbacteria bacterium]|nr:hypothetical protein [Candidatus Moranbacteria bacterium]
MFIDPPKRSEQLLKYALVALGATLVVVMLAALFSFDIGSGPKKESAKQETTPSPETELKLQEEIAPLIKAGDMKACDSVSNDMYKKVCINNIALNKAEETKDIAYCRHIDNELIPRADCERQVVTTLSLEKEDQTLCDQATDETVKTQCKESYHLALALNKSDSTICTQASNPVTCTDNFFLQQFTQDPSKVSCDVFSTTEAQSDCAVLKKASADQKTFARFCQEKQSELFTPLCMMVGMNTGLSPQVLPTQQ